MFNYSNLMNCVKNKDGACSEFVKLIQNFRAYIKKIGNIDYKKVTLEHGEIHRQLCLDNGNAPATIAKKLKHLKRLFQLAVNRKQLDENPLRHIDMPKSRKKKIRIYTEAECQRIIKIARQYCQMWSLQYAPQWDLMIIVALTTAMRRSELLNCTWSNIDFEQQVINIAPKINSECTWRWDIKDIGKNYSHNCRITVQPDYNQRTS